jgi:type I restriction-modification system DNA methylase subunit
MLFYRRQLTLLYRHRRKLNLTSVLERNIQIELYRILQNLVANKFTFNDIEFTSVKYEPTINGRPDLVVEAIDKGKKMSLLVIETKRKVPFIDRKFDPYSKDVIRQASGYALDLGAPYFATCNGEVLVLFDTFTAGVPLPQRKLKHYKVSFDEEFAKALLEEVCRFRIGVGKWLELDDVFLQRLRTFHTFITPYMLKALNGQLKEDVKFKKEYVAWLKSQLFEYSPKMNEMIAEQFAYMLMNRLMFYKTIETQVSVLPKLTKIETEDPKMFSDRLRGIFDKVCKDVDYEAIFEPHPILDQILLPKTLIFTLNDFIEELGTYDLSKIQSDVIGRVYEELIPDVERHRLGQYYTPPPIIELITEMCIKSPNDKVLDPSCGSGGFLVKAYHKLKDLKKKENPFADDAKLHEEILNQLYGVDINQFPAQLSSINLAVRNLKVTSRNINLIVSDFFKVKPSMGIIPKEIDVVVTNPPYTRQEEMEYKDKIREEALTYSDGSKIDIGAQAGIYAYFFTHSAKFLKNHGRMGYITSNTWLDVSFGEGLKQFFLDHFKILAVIEHDAGVFEKANVDTCIVILEKAEGNDFEKERRVNSVRFARLKKASEIGEIIALILLKNVDYENDTIRMHLKKQGELKSEEKWGKYLRAPTVFYKITSNPKMSVIRELAKVKRGFTTGANEFFYLDKGKTMQWGVEKRYLHPIITSPRYLTACIIESKNIDEYVLLVHETKENLKNTNVLKYIEHGESVSFEIRRGKQKGQQVQGYQNVPMIKSRRLWYDLGSRDTAPLLFPCKIRKRCFFAWNKDSVYADKSFYEIFPNEKEASLVLAGLLNSTLTMLLIELHGRLYGRGLLELEVYELENLPIVDINKLTDKQKDRIKDAFLEICARQNKGDRKLEQKAKIELDNAVFDVLQLKERERQQIYEGLESLRRMRLQRKEVDVLVETAEKWKPHKKPEKEKRIKLEPSKRLDKWIER